MKKRLLSILLVVVMVLGAAPFTLAACSSGNVIKRKPENSVTYDFSDKNVILKAKNPVSKTLNWIDMDRFSNNDLMMVTTLQGNVNRVTPNLYVLHDEIVEGPADVNSSEYWFKKLPEQYTGDQAFDYIEYRDPYELLAAKKEDIKGAVLYHERLADAEMSGRENYASRYADIAVLNLTIMMCAEYEAVALTYEQYNCLRDQYGVTLSILGDTTLFMEKDENGAVSENRASMEVWDKVYRYSLATFTGFTDQAIGHNSGFQAATFDYYVQNKIFIYNRIFSSAANEDQRNLELAILNVSKPNTPVLGCWYLQADEGSLVPLLTEKYKYFIVNYESFNWSWTTALPKEEFTVEEEKLTLDETKNYIAFTFTEGDNNSYVHFRMPAMFESSARGEYPIGWTIAPTVWETNPNIIKYYKDNWAEGDGLAIPEAGVDYVYHCPPEESQDEFFALSDEYLGRVGNGMVRMLGPDPVDPLPYAAKMENLEGMLLGYYDTGNSYYNSSAGNFMFRGKPFFLNYSGADVMNLNQAESQGPGFYAVTLLGWNQDPSTVKNAMDSLGDNFVAVTPSQLADLYKQKYDKDFNKITQADFTASMTREEMGFLYEASDYSAFDGNDKCRFADQDNFFTYRFNFKEGIKQSTVNATVSGDYQIEASTDYLNWTVMASGKTEEKKMIALDLKKQLKKSDTVYLRFGDRTTENEGGARLYHLGLTTNATARENFEITAVNDSSYLVKGGSLTEAGRQGTFVYGLDLAESAASGDLAILTRGELTAEISRDNKSFSGLSLTKQGLSYYARLENLSGRVYLRLNAAAAVEKVKYVPDGAAVKQLNFSPVSNELTKGILVSPDPAKVVETSFNSNRSVDGASAMIYRFTIAEGVLNAKLVLTLSGLYKVEVGNDNVSYTTLKQVAAGEIPEDKISLDITNYAGAGKTVYVKISMSTSLAGKSVKLSKFRLITNLTEAWLTDKVDSERQPDGKITVEAEVNTEEGANPDRGLEVTDSAENYLLDQTRSNDYFLYMANYVVPNRALSDSEASQIVYRINLTDSKLYELLGIDPVTAVTRLRVNLLILNAYKISASNDGEIWTELYDTNDSNIQAGGNIRDLDLSLNNFLSDSVIYLKISHSSARVPGKTHSGMVRDIKFYFN